MRIQLAPRIVADAEICFGKLTIEGTRVPVEIVVGKLAGGMSTDDVAAEYGLSRSDVLSALSYASNLISKKRRRLPSPR